MKSSGVRIVNTVKPVLRRLERVFRCYSVCETMQDEKKRIFNGVEKLYVSLQLYCWAIL